ncbi:MAG TPA: hypothetical protein H9703_05390 [Candidatus Faecalibacterium faecigallinarum]|uniref:Uncharacterized protein n=1 Tax=Candidatus Faecalibacterium faecigallinarum TaxID=2838577 RepID=A0A9D2T3B0_9FIRM|nr:hypothetical protein [Candidatus Faecalibacterium faecigallinarum]
MTFPANYAVIAEDELTYVTGGGVIANVLPAVMTSENWRTFSTNLIKIVGNTVLGNFVGTVLGTAFGTNYAFGGIIDAINTELGKLNGVNGLLQSIAGLAAIYTLGTAGAKTVQDNNVIGVSGAAVEA